MFLGFGVNFLSLFIRDQCTAHVMLKLLNLMQFVTMFRSHSCTFRLWLCNSPHIPLRSDSYHTFYQHHCCSLCPFSLWSPDECEVAKPFIRILILMYSSLYILHMGYGHICTVLYFTDV